MRFAPLPGRASTKTRLALTAIVLAACSSPASSDRSEGASVIGALQCLAAHADWTTPDPGNIWTQGLDMSSQNIGDENVLPNEADVFSQMVQDVNAMQDQLASNTGAPLARGFHAKAHACVLGTFHVRVPDSLSQARVGLFANDGDYPAWVRYSNGVGFGQADKNTDVRGLGVKVMKVPGQSLLPQEATTQDFLMTNAPITPAPDSQQFVNFGKAIVTAKVTSSGVLGPIEQMAKSGAYLTQPENGRLCAYLKDRAEKSVLTKGSPLAEQFWTGGAFAMGVDTSSGGDPLTAHAQQAAKITAVPGIQADDGSCITEQKLPDVLDDDYMRTDIKKRMKDGPTCIDIQMQFQTDASRQPIEDTSVEWRTDDSPFVSVATITVPQTDLDGDTDAQARESFCNALSFTPWHTLPDHRPLGNIMRARRGVYGGSASHRGASAEPTGDEFAAAPPQTTAPAGDDAGDEAGDDAGDDGGDDAGNPH